MRGKGLYYNRELSWLNFNERILDEATNPDNPLLEQARFVSIVSNNLDEFFMVRVGKLERKKDMGRSRPDIAGLLPQRQLALIRRRVRAHVGRQYRVYNQRILPQLALQGIHLLGPDSLEDRQRQWLSQYFDAQVLPALTPRTLNPQHPFPILSAKTIHIAVLLQSDKGGDPQVAIVSVPRAIKRLVLLPMGQGRARGLLLDDLITMFLPRLFLQMAPLAFLPFRLTRNTDFVINLDDMHNLLNEMSKNVQRRSYGKIVRMEVPRGAHPLLLHALQTGLEVADEAVCQVDGPLDLRFIMRQVCDLPGFDRLRYPIYSPRVDSRLLARESIFRTIRGGDIFLHHPYDSFDPIVRFLSEAASDQNVLAIKQTLYRVSSHSPMIDALARAAQSGKQVTVLIEVRARFDEEHNIAWSKALEKAGCHVLYGVPRWKTHSKVTLVVRREADGLRHYTHFGTGNYNDVTARIYTDMGVLTCDKQLGEDAAAFFNLILGYSYTYPMREMIASPYRLREAMLEKIAREAKAARQGLPCGITMKMNSLSDQQMIDALRGAARDGVPVRLMVRGICCLNYHEHPNLQVFSAVGRFLEHPRVYSFHNQGEAEVYLSSADLMPRNLDKRVELTTPVKDPRIKAQILSILELGLLDNRKLWRLVHGNHYERVPRALKEINAQEELLRSPNPLLDRQILRG
ncbi:MAG: polyphosphate kinase 1 [Clostridiales bacterium]|nr:polyphosphate kinase 1 [Clostridiales bacterium]